MAAIEIDTDQVLWEYAFLSASGGQSAQLIQRLNDIAAEGWELVNLAVQDAGYAGTALGAPVRRRVDPLPPPPTGVEGWYQDPAGRFDQRLWNGRAWTFHVARNEDKSTHRDPPTARPPTADLAQ